jgi:cytidine deaminase
VIVARTDGSVVSEVSLHELLPGAFTPADLKPGS